MSEHDQINIQSEVTKDEDVVSNGKPKLKRFSERLKEVEVEIEGDDGVVRNYIVREMKGDKLSRWMEFTAMCVEMDRNGQPISADFSGYHATLISMCLYYKENNKLVPKDVIKCWGSSTQNGLFDLCEEVNGMSRDAKGRAKKG